MYNMKTGKVMGNKLNLFNENIDDPYTLYNLSVINYIYSLNEKNITAKCKNIIIKLYTMVLLIYE